MTYIEFFPWRTKTLYSWIFLNQVNFPHRSQTREGQIYKDRTSPTCETPVDGSIFAWGYGKKYNDQRPKTESQIFRNHVREKSLWLLISCMPVGAPGGAGNLLRLWMFMKSCGQPVPEKHPRTLCDTRQVFSTFFLDQPSRKRRLKKQASALEPVEALTCARRRLKNGSGFRASNLLAMAST